MKLKWTNPIPAWPRIATVALLVTVTCFLVAAQFPVVELTNTPTVSRIAELEDNEQTLNLAVEFGFDPIIVKVVRQKSVIMFDKPNKNRLMWRLIRTPEALSFGMLSLIKAESGGNPRAVSVAAAYGLTQLQLPTARMYDKSADISALFSIETNIDLAFLHLEYLMDKYNGNWPLVLLSWNRGEGRVDSLIRIGQSPDNGYVRAVLTAAMSRNALLLNGTIR